MAETLGSLHDKLSIANIRLGVISSKIIGVYNDDVEKYVNLCYSIRGQSDELQKEIEEYKAAALSGKLTKLEEPKYKIYQGENSSGVGFDDLEDAIFHLSKMNKLLWDLEDARRDKTKGDKEVRGICDEVARINRLRNDTMDEINRLFNKSVETAKIPK